MSPNWFRHEGEQEPEPSLARLVEVEQVAKWFHGAKTKKCSFYGFLKESLQLCVLHKCFTLYFGSLFSAWPVTATLLRKFPQVTEEHKMSPLIMEINEEREINYFKALIVFKNYEHNTTFFNWNITTRKQLKPPCNSWAAPALENLEEGLSIGS